MAREFVLQIRAEVAGMEISFADTELEPSDVEALNERLDTMTKVVGRLKSKQDLAERLIAVEAITKSLELLPEHGREILQKRAEDRVALEQAGIAAMKARLEERAQIAAGERARFEAAGRRREYKPSAMLVARLEEFDKKTIEMMAQFDLGAFDEKTADKKRDLDAKKLEYERDIALGKVQISRLRAVIAGRDPTDFMPETEAA